MHRETFCEFSDTFSQLPALEQSAAVIHLLKLLDEAPSTVSAAEEEPSVGDTKEPLENKDHTSHPSSHLDELSERGEPQPLPPPPPPPAADHCREQVTLLASLCPISVPEDYLADLFINQSNKDLQTAANKILEQGPEALQAEIITWEAAAAANRCSATSAHQEATTGTKAKIMTGNSPLKPDEELRRSIVAKFHLEAIPSGGGGKGTKLAAWGTQNSGNTATRQNSGLQKLRYRDGVVVSTKGEKYIVEKEPEWDGGSRGKVKSKGKRGVGWQ